MILVAAVLAASPAIAGEWSLLLNGKATHINVPPGRNYNERNWGLGVQYDFVERDKEPDRKWIPFLNASEFQDSNRNLSYYAGGGIHRRFRPLSGSDTVHLDLGVVGFIMHRENFRNGRLFPGALPTASIGTDRVSVNITYIPKVDPKMVALWFFQLKVALF